MMSRGEPDFPQEYRRALTRIRGDDIHEIVDIAAEFADRWAARDSLAYGPLVFAAKMWREFAERQLIRRGQSVSGWARLVDAHTCTFRQLRIQEIPWMFRDALHLDQTVRLLGTDALWFQEYQE
jgi:hypothetical protein